MKSLSLLALLGSTLVSPAHAEQWLDGDALHAMVLDRTAVCRHVSRPSYGRTYYAPDGSMYGIRRGELRSGRWYIEDNTLCTDWGVRAICSRYRADDTGGHYKYTLSGKQTVHILEWLPGDQVE
jgi:hypothetical protein